MAYSPKLGACPHGKKTPVRISTSLVCNFLHCGLTQDSRGFVDNLFLEMEPGKLSLAVTHVQTLTLYGTDGGNTGSCKDSVASIPASLFSELSEIAEAEASVTESGLTSMDALAADTHWNGESAEDPPAFLFNSLPGRGCELNYLHGTAIIPTDR